MCVEKNCENKALCFGVGEALRMYECARVCVFLHRSEKSRFSPNRILYTGAQILLQALWVHDVDDK